jgi:NAD(P)-dependent dehydrogenase (short-subunit alcohol dehydrogenase family)
MGPYAASKAGVEGLTDSLRMEMAPTGSRAGCAYFGFIDTDLVKASMEHPSSKAMEGLMPAWIRKSIPVSGAVDAIERGIERRSGRVWAPRYVGGALAIRGVLQPLTELRIMRTKDLAEALRLADPANGGLDGQDPTLGVAASAAEREKVNA